MTYWAGKYIIIQRLTPLYIRKTTYTTAVYTGDFGGKDLVEDGKVAHTRSHGWSVL